MHKTRKENAIAFINGNFTNSYIRSVINGYSSQDLLNILSYHETGVINGHKIFEFHFTLAHLGIRVERKTIQLIKDELNERGQAIGVSFSQTSQ